MSREHFDSTAQDYDDQDNVDRARQIADALRSGLALTGDERVLEYGAGTGLVQHQVAIRLLIQQGLGQQLKHADGVEYGSKGVVQDIKFSLLKLFGKHAGKTGAHGKNLAFVADF